jgi:AsmA protein
MPGAPPEARRRRKLLMKRRHIIIASVVGALGLLLAIPFLLPLDTYRAPIERAASAALGRQVQIRGSMGLTVYPQIGISLGDVSIANPQGARHPQMVEVESVVVGAKLMPLFSRRLEITEVVLQNPIIHLEVNRNGTSNWQLGAGTQAKAGETNSRIASVGVGKLSVEGGQVTYDDAGSGTSHAITDVDFTLAMPLDTRTNVRVPFVFNGGLTYNSQPLRMSGRIENFDAFMRAQPTQARLEVASTLINAKFEGSLGKEGQISGPLNLGAHSVRSLAAWLGYPLPPGNGFGLVALEGQFTAADGVYSLRQTQLRFDSMSMNANLSFDTNPDVMLIKGSVTLDRLDLNPYLAPGAETDTVQAAKAKAANPDAPLSLGGLKAVDAEVQLVVGSMVLPGFRLDHGRVDADLKGGVLKAELRNLSLYGGNGRGSLTVDASGDTPSIRSTLDLSGLRVQPFLNQLMEVNNVTGTGTLRFDIAGRGKTQAQLIRALNGRGEMRFTDGAVTGVDLGAVARVMQSVVTAQVLTGAVGPNAQTAFGQMGGTFTVKDGVLNTTDLKLTSDVVELNGQGNVDLGAQTVDFRFEPVAKRGIPGLRLVDIGIPFLVKGPWDKPTYGPDPRGVARAVVNKLGRGATAPVDIVKDPAAALKSLFGGR